MEYLLDTNTCIYIIRKKPIRVLERFQSLSLGSVGISTITLAELQHGVVKSVYVEENQQALHEFLVPVDILDFDYEAAMIYGEIRTHWSARYVDCRSCQKFGCDRCDDNEKEFRRVPGLKVENWMV